MSIVTPLPDRPHLYLPAEAQLRLDQLNRVWNDDIVANRAAVIELYTPLVRRAVNDAVTVWRDLPYGSDPRQVLDVFAPKDADNARVVAFVHGGAFTRGNKSTNGDFFDNVGYWFAAQGFVFVNIEYRLAPASQFPGGARDVGAAVEWIAAQIPGYGGNPGDIALMGHSAGGCHVASYLLDEQAWSRPSDSITAAILISARLRLECRPENPNAKNVAAYCGRDPEVLARCSPVSHVQRCRWPVFIAIAEYENRFLDAYCLEFAARLAESRGVAPRLVQMQGHNHSSIMAHFNSGEDSLGRQILAFLGNVK